MNEFQFQLIPQRHLDPFRLMSRLYSIIIENRFHPFRVLIQTCINRRTEAELWAYLAFDKTEIRANMTIRQPPFSIQIDC